MLFLKSTFNDNPYCPAPRNGGPARPGLAVSAAGTRVSVSGSGRVQPADAALCPTESGQNPRELLKSSRGWVFVWMVLLRPTDALLAVIVRLWPGLLVLDVIGEQRQRLQAIAIRVYRG